MAIAKLQVDFGRVYAIRPRAFLVSQESTFAPAVRALYGASLPPYVEAIFVSCCGVNAPSLLVRNSTDPSYADAHEVAHWMIWQTAGNRLPLWFDEGLAEYEARTLAGSEAFRSTNRCTASLVARNNTVPADPNQIDMSLAWAYPVASEAVGLLIGDLGMAGIVRILELVKAGSQFEPAYSFVSGKSFSDFTATYRERLAKLANPC